MEYNFAIHYKLRRGLGPDWIAKIEEIGFDDLPPETTYEEAKEMAISEFKHIRHSKGSSERTYYITDINLT